MLLRRTIIISLALAFVACASPREFKPEDLPPFAPLRDPPEGKAVLYLLRAPHDSTTLPVYLDEKQVALLPPASYTHLVVDPKAYLVASSPLGNSPDAPASSVALRAGQRRFLYVSATTGRATKLAVTPIGGLGVLPLLLPSYDSTGPRTWKECTELDAQGFISISRHVDAHSPA